MVTKQEIKEWLETHETTDMSGKDIAKAMISEAIQNTEFAEEFYPGLKEKMLNALKTEMTQYRRII